MEQKSDRTMMRFLVVLLSFVFFLLFSVVLLSQTVFVLTQKTVLPRMGSLFLMAGIRQQLGISGNEDTVSALQKLLINVPDTAMKPIEGFDFSVSYKDVQGKNQQQLRQWLESTYLLPFYNQGLDYLKTMCNDSAIREQLNYALQQTTDPMYFSPTYINGLLSTFRTVFFGISLLLVLLVGFLARGRARLVVPGVLFVLSGLPGFILNNALTDVLAELADQFKLSGIQAIRLTTELQPIISKSLNAYLWSFEMGVGLVVLGVLLGFIGSPQKR